MELISRRYFCWKVGLGSLTLNSLVHAQAKYAFLYEPSGARATGSRLLGWRPDMASAFCSAILRTFHLSDGV
jgi:hypothetical protein